MHPEPHIEDKPANTLTSKPTIVARNLWFDISIYSIILLIVISLYQFVTHGTYDLRLLNRSVADVSLILIALSFMLSGLCYFWNFADHYISYRKQLGVIGFIYALFHMIIVVYMSGTLTRLIPQSITEIRDLALISAEVALVLYIGMIIVSTKSVIRRIGGLHWRQLLRYGYIALILSILHFGLLGHKNWLLWLTGQTSKIFPPTDLLVFLFGIIVLALRITLWLYTRNNKISHTTPSTQTPPTTDSTPQK